MLSLKKWFISYENIYFVHFSIENHHFHIYKPNEELINNKTFLLFKNQKFVRFFKRKERKEYRTIEEMSL